MGAFPGSSIQPLRVEQVYRCLSEHLGVAYTFAEADEPPAPEAVDWSDIVLPSDLHADLSEAVAHNNVTRLRQHIGALAELNDKGQGLAAHLSELGKKYDMGGIKAVLEKVERE